VAFGLAATDLAFAGAAWGEAMPGNQFPSSGIFSGSRNEKNLERGQH